MADHPSNAPPPDTLVGLDLTGMMQLAMHSQSTPWVPPPAAALAGQIPQCDITELLGRGGMGAVYRARQTALDREVAVKILPPEADPDGSMGERFRREGRILARLVHPHIVAVFDSGTTPDGYLYIVMELATAGDLAKRMREGLLPIETSLTILQQVGSAVSAAHEQAVLHRDLKPSNVLLMDDGTAKVADFGLAVPLQLPESERLTREESTMGTAEYSAPEQFTSRKGGAAPDQRADIYSLGVLAYEMFTGDLPRGVFELPSKRTPGLDPAVDAVILQALQSDPMRRFATVAEFCTALTAAMDRPRQQAQRDREARQQLRRRTRLAGAFGSLAILAAGAAIYGWFHQRAAEAHAAEARSQKSEATTARGEAEALVSFMLGDVGEKLERSNQLDLLEDVVAGAGNYFNRRAAAAPTDWLAQTQRAAFLQTQASVLDGRGKRTEALESLREAVNLCQVAMDAEPDEFRWHLAWFKAQRKLGEKLKTRSDHELSLQCYQALEAKAGAGISKFPDKLEPHFYHAMALAGQADVLSYLKRYESSAEAYRRAGELLGECSKQFPGDLSVRKEEIIMHASLGSLWEQMGRMEEALTEFRRHDEMVRQYAAQRGGNWDYQISHAEMRVGVALRKLGRLPEAKTQFNEATVLAERASAAHPGDAVRLLHLEFLYDQLGSLLPMMGETTQAADYQLKAKRLGELRNDPMRDPKRSAVASTPTKSPEELALESSFAALTDAKTTLDDARKWAKASTALADVASRNGGAKSALAHYVLWAGKLEEKLHLAPTDAKLAVALASTLNRQADFWVKENPPQALKTYLRSLELRHTVYNNLPEDATAQRDYISSLGHVLELRTAVSTPEEILAACENAAAACAAIPGPALVAGYMDQWISVSTANALQRIIEKTPAMTPQVKAAAQKTLSALFDRTDTANATRSAQTLKALDALRRLAELGKSEDF